MGAKVLVLELKGAEADLSNVFSVSYKIAGTTDGARTFAAQGFKYVFKPSRTGSFKVVAVITTLAGKNFEKTLTVSGR
jgi:hypothetical protein